jgi:hypothetical protein
MDSWPLRNEDVRDENRRQRIRVHLNEEKGHVLLHQKNALSPGWSVGLH